MPVHVVEHTKAGLKLEVAAQSMSGKGENAEVKAGKGAGVETGAGSGAGARKGAERIAQEAWLSGQGGTGEWAGI